MAYQYNSDIWGRIRPKIQQWESTTGRTATPSLLREWIDAELSTEAQKAERSRAYDIQNKYLELNKEKMAQEGRAATISGIGQLGQAGIGAYGLGKEAGLWGGGSTGAGLATGGATVASSSGATQGAQMLLGTPTATPALQGVAPLTAEAGLMTGAETAGATALPSAPGLTLGGAMLPAGAGAVGGMAGAWLGSQPSFQEMTPWGGEKTERMAGGAMGGATAGAAVGSIVPGVGTVIGGIIGGITGLVGGGK